jgi:hypothetical protein
MTVAIAGVVGESATARFSLPRKDLLVTEAAPISGAGVSRRRDVVDESHGPTLRTPLVGSRGGSSAGGRFPGHGAGERGCSPGGRRGGSLQGPGTG